MPNQPSAPERVQSAFRKLSTSASGLNNASKDLGRTIAELDALLKELNLGISAWVTISEGSSPDGFYWWSRSIGYAKVGNEWGIALRDSSGDQNGDEIHNIDRPFDDAPRWMRIESIGKIPDLLEHLTKQADDTTEKIRKKTVEAKAIAAAIKAAAAESKASMPISALGVIPAVESEAKTLRSAWGVAPPAESKATVPLSALGVIPTAESVTKARK